MLTAGGTTSPPTGLVTLTLGLSVLAFLPMTLLGVWADGVPFGLFVLTPLAIFLINAAGVFGYLQIKRGVSLQDPFPLMRASAPAGLAVAGVGAAVGALGENPAMAALGGSLGSLHVSRDPGGCAGWSRDSSAPSAYLTRSLIGMSGTLSGRRVRATRSRAAVNASGGH